MDWCSQAVLPTAVAFLHWLHESDSSFPLVLPPSSTANETPFRYPRALLLITTISSIVALLQPFTSSPVLALSLSSAASTSLAYTLIERILGGRGDEGMGKKEDLRPVNGSHANGSRGGRLSVSAPMTQASLGRILQELAVVASIGCGCASLCLETFRFNGVEYRPELENYIGDDWRTGMRYFGMLQALLVAIAAGLKNLVMIALVQHQGALSPAFTDLGGAHLIRLLTSVTFTAAWFSSLSAAATYCFFHDPLFTSYAASKSRRKMRAKQLTILFACCSFIGFTVLLLRHPHSLMTLHLTGPKSKVPPIDTKPLMPSNTQSHPIDQLITEAERDWKSLKARQSSSLAGAVAEYRRRYGIPPPPKFDKWYEFARNKGVQLVDEYDTIFHSLLPFWALEPWTIRERAREALGFDNALLGLLIRDGQAVKVEGGDEWQQKATVGMMKDFVQYLPDMDLAFNVHDEPRVIVPHGDLTRLVSKATDESMPAALAEKSPRNAWSRRPGDMNDGKRFPEVRITRFNRFAHQPTWTPSRQSCPPESPSRNLDESTADNITSYAFSELGFVYNKTAFSDICMSPSLRERYGFFDRPNAFDIVHDLFPIFSQSKISSFQDILYPSPWYWAGKVTYEEEKDFKWDKKEDKMYWRGSTTGGFSRDGGWRRQHRQRFVQKINALGTARVHAKQVAADGTTAEWKVKEVSRPDYKDIFDVKFTYVGQCDPGDCDAQREFFQVVEPAEQQDAWAYKYLLDIDGNAFSGRFYAFLKSMSLVYKVAVFREWHEEWIRPWVHYIPLSLKGEEYVESVRYFAQEEEGKLQAPRIAVQGREWAGKALRNEDFEVWFFRLLLEYGRLVDDNREIIGYAGP
ncbi:MAG: hypothetical protein LQ347_005240 [Umbilicaria vellea]|nr:MAG: hypothetical protein LQ347_005240 [Umbilicaria vellea]